MSEYGQRRIARFPSKSPIHNPKNPMHELLNGIGMYEDYLEDLMFKYIEKANIQTNISTDDESEEDYLLGYYMLNRIGESYKLKRNPNEDNNTYRGRILSIIDNDGTILSLKRIISNILGIDINDVEIIETERSYFLLGDELDSRIKSVNSKPLMSRITNISQFIVINVPKDCDISSLESTLKNCVLANVKIQINKN
jgi:hypothetical protein